MNRSCSAPLTYGQLSVLRSLEGLAPGQRADGNVVNLWQIPPGIARQRLTDAWLELLRVNEGLRSTYRLDAGANGQAVMPVPAARLEARRLADPSAAAARAEANRWRARPFALVTEPPSRAFLGVCDGAPRYLVSVIHHVAADGHARMLLREQFERILAGSSPQSAMQPAELAIQQREAGAVAERRMNYWCSVWRDLEEDDRRGGGSEHKVCAEVFSRPALQAGQDIAASLQISVPAVVLAATVLALSRLKGRTGMTLGLMAANRFRPRWARIVTSMNQLAPVTLHAEGSRDVEGYLRETYVKSMEAYWNGCYDVDELRSRLAGESHPNPDPVRFDIYFNFLGALVGDPPGQDAITSVDWLDYKRSSGPLLSLVAATEEGLLLSARASRSYLPDDTAGRLVASIEAALISLAEDRPARLGEVRAEPRRPLHGPGGGGAR